MWKSWCKPAASARPEPGSRPKRPSHQNRHRTRNLPRWIEAKRPTCVSDLPGPLGPTRTFSVPTAIAEAVAGTSTDDGRPPGRHHDPMPDPGDRTVSSLIKMAAEPGICEGPVRRRTLALDPLRGMAHNRPEHPLRSKSELTVRYGPRRSRDPPRCPSSTRGRYVARDTDSCCHHPGFKDGR